MWTSNNKTQTKTGKILFVHIVLVQKSNITNLHGNLKSHFPGTILEQHHDNSSFHSNASSPDYAAFQLRLFIMSAGPFH